RYYLIRICTQHFYYHQFLMKKIILLVSPFLLLLLSCEKEPLNQADKVVVEAFLFAGEKVDNIRLTTLVPFGGTDTIPKPINNAQVSIWCNHQELQQQNTNDSGFYHYPSNDLIIKTDEQYELKFEYNNFDISATTICPPPPSSVNITKDTMKIVFFSLIDS